MITHEHTMCLYTVPHTGAHFVTGLLETVDLLSSRDYNTDHWRTRPKALPPQQKFLVTARDPYLSALRYIYNGDPIEDAAKSWNTCLANLYNIDHYLIDIGCRKRDRMDHVLGAIAFLNIDPEQHVGKLNPYIEAWKPVHTTEEITARGVGVAGAENNKSIYLETGKLPDGYDWSLFDGAVAWYKSLSTNDHV